MNEFHKKVLITDIFNLLLVLILFFCLLQIRQTTSSVDNTSISVISKNLSTSPFEEIEVLENNSSCPKGKLPLINEKWHGTVEGCFCSRSEFYQRACTSAEIKKDCVSVKPKTSSEIHNWQGRRICVKPYTGNYFSMVVSKKCVEKDKNCGKIDSLGQFLCVSKEVDCPINKIMIVDQDEEVSEEFTVIKLSGKKKLIYSNAADEKAIIATSTKVSQAKPCANPFFTNYAEPYYPLNYDVVNEQHKCFDKLGEYTYMSNLKKMDSMNFLEMLEDNFLKEYTESLPDFQFVSGEKEATLYSGIYYGIDADLVAQMRKDNLNFDNMLLEMQDLSNFKLENSILRDISLFCCITICVCLLVFKLIANDAFSDEYFTFARKFINFTLWCLLGAVTIISIVNIFSFGNKTSSYDWISYNEKNADEVVVNLISSFCFGLVDIFLYYLGMGIVGFLSMWFPLYEYIGDYKQSEYSSFKLVNKVD